MAVNHHLRLALDQVSDAVIVVEGGPLTSPGPKVLYANEAMAEATGVAATGLCDVPLGALCDGDVLLNMLIALSGSMGGAVEATAALNHLQAQPTPCRWSAVRVRDGGGQTLNFILTATPDISSGVKSPAAVAPATAAPASVDGPPPRPDEYQQDLVETIRDTARYVAHEFNNALTAILLPVQMAIRQVPEGGDLHGKLQMANESARRAADLAKDFLDCFRPRPAARERCRLDGLLGRAMRLATCAQNVNWSLEVAEDLFDAEVDPNQIERVIFNLVRNACQAMPNGGKLLVKASNTAVSASEGHALKPGNYVHISVRDWGPGIPEEHMPHLFHSCFTTKDNGNGCGLPICYQIVREHGGDMYVKSRPQVGTAFLIFLPALTSRAPAPAPAVRATPATTPLLWPPLTPPAATVAPEQNGFRLPPLVPELSPLITPPFLTIPPPSLLKRETAPVHVEPMTAPPADNNAPSILVVDDEDGVCRALAQIGKAYGFEVITASNSDEGIQSYRDRLRSPRPYDTVLLDINLRGGLNGIEVFHVLRRLDPGVNVIATSGQFSEGDLQRFQEIGFAGFLPKPFTLEDFDQVVQEVLVAH